MRAAILLILALGMPATPLLAVPLPETAAPRPPQEAVPPAGSATPGPLPVPVAPRGQMLYENHCLGCHESVLFIRARRAVRSLPELRDTVARWAREARAPWRDEEIDAVTGHLNRTYYRFPEP